MHLQFYGAARTVTGSMHMVSVNGCTILLDCGIYHGRREESRIRNETMPFDPGTVSAVVLSHAHIDHSGNLPTLVREGFHGPIFCTGATKSLCEIMLRDSAYIQEKDAQFINKRYRNRPAVAPLYTEHVVDETLPLLTEVPYSRSFDVGDGIQCRFEDAGHILGSASLALTLREDSHNVQLAFTGDLGRPNLPILRDPVFIGPEDGVDFLISESTYGGRMHAPVEEMKDQLLDPIRRACERKGKIVIPAFSVGRTQEVVYMLHKLHGEGKIDLIPVYVDSPLSVNVTEVFRKHAECFDEEVLAVLHSARDNDPFGFERLTYIKSVEQSKELNDISGPCIIIAASGMCEAGRIVHHLANCVGDVRNMILIVGYQAENTLGKKLVLKEPVVNIFGEAHEVKAEVVVLNSFSGHADKNELVSYISQFPHGRMKEIFLVHGDLDQAQKLQCALEDAGFGDIMIPTRGNIAQLD